MSIADVEKLADDTGPSSPSSSSENVNVVNGGNEAGGHDQLQNIATKEHGSHDLEKNELTQTKSIAETLSLPHEIAFVTVVCMAQFFTRGLTACWVLVYTCANDTYRGITWSIDLNHRSHRKVF